LILGLTLFKRRQAKERIAGLVSVQTKAMAGS